MLFKTSSIEDTKLIFHILRKKYPDKQVLISQLGDYYQLSLQDFQGKQLLLTVPLFVKICIVYGDTDSIFASIKYNRQDFQQNRIDTFTLAQHLSDTITETVFDRKPIQLEFEKVFQPFILLTKKRYIGKKYCNPKDPFELKEITKSGIAITRRDYCKMVKNCYNEVIDSIVNENDTDKGVNVYKSYLQRIIEYGINLDDLVVSALLAKTYKTRPVHVQLCEKLKERKEEVQIGDRIPYVYIENTTDTRLQKSELGEDPVYVKEHGLKFNRFCYIEQLSKPLLGFFKCILDKPQLSDLEDYTSLCLKNAK